MPYSGKDFHRAYNLYYKSRMPKCNHLLGKRWLMVESFYQHELLHRLW